ncbi:hypothetical protein DFP73DRAFT_478774 [Morchella snyderi]|nr:hypothetical protein DFP73DRAFT_478774 [Morchella snyderi]
MENQHSTQSELRHSFVPNFAPISREDRMMSPAGNSVHPTPVHPQYLHQPRQQQQSSLPGTPQHSSTHHSASSSPYHSSFPMNRINTSTEQQQQQQQHPSPAPYPHSMPPSRNSSHPASAPSGGGYLDPTAYLNMSDVMSMGMEPLPMGGTMGGNMDMDLSILSAEEHGDLKILEERERIRRMQTSQHDYQMGGRRGDDLKGRGAGVGRGRKRADSDDSGHDPTPVARGGPGGSSNRKQRGRPRLDTKDENAADRRRTQIRLAQRAYRLRKETTISSLRNRVNELETAIDGMQTTFLELHDSAMSCLSKNPDAPNHSSFGSNLKQLTEKFLGLAKEALGSSEGAETGDEDAEGESINEDDGNGNARSKRRRSRDDGSPGSGGGGGGMQAGGGNGSVPSFGGYQVSYSRENGNSRGSRSSYDNNGNSQNRSAGAGAEAAGSGASGRSNTMTTSSSFSLGSHNREHGLYSPSSPESAYMGGLLQSPPSDPASNTVYKQDIPAGLESFSYSFHETNFSRRLHRAGLEYAHLILTSPNADQYEVARVFAYTFCYTTREAALECITKLLQIGPKESLDLREHPEIQPLPRKPLDYTESMQSYEAERAGGQVQEPKNREESDMREEANKMLIKLGIHQKYLRPDEVEQYITNLGILTSTSADLMEMDVESEHSRQASPSLAQPPQTLRPRSPPQTPPARTANANQMQGGLTSATVMSLDYFQPQAMETLEDQINYQVRQFEKNHSSPAGANEIASIKVLEGVKKQVDLDMFIKQLIPRAVCLGRFPGFKKSDVEAAISLATVPVY